MVRMMREERIARGWSRADLSKMVGITEEAIRLIENGQRDPSYKVLVKLEDTFGLSHRELMTESN